MTQLNIRKPENTAEEKLHWRDWVLLPMLSLLTISLLVVPTELIARRMFPDVSSTMQNCLIVNDYSTGVRGIPNSACWGGVRESGPVEYRFNACGHRAGMNCGPKPPDTYRIVMVGTSTVMGWSVPREKTFAALLPTELSQRTGRKVELYNEGLLWESPLGIILRFNEVLAAKPDMILWVLSPMEPESASIAWPRPDEMPKPATKGIPVSKPKNIPAKVLNRVKVDLATKSIPDALRDLWTESQMHFMTRGRYMLLHFLYASQSQGVKSALRGTEAEYLTAEPSPKSRDALQVFDRYTAEIGARAKAANVPLVVVLVPSRAQAAMISIGEWPAGLDPYREDNELHSIITNRGGTYIDILPDFRTIPNPEQHYFPIDEHPDAQGHAMISGLLAKELTSGAIPALRNSGQPHIPSDLGR